MCLYITNNQDQNNKDLKRWFGRRQKFAYVYKVLQKRASENFYRSSWHPEFIWDFSKQKEYQVDRDPKPTEKELYSREIHKGFHIYTSLKEVKYHKSTFRPIVKFRVNKEDIIAIENDYDDPEEHNFSEAVCRKLTFVKVLKS
jgi:hypothetical protein